MTSSIAQSITTLEHFFKTMST